MCKRSINDTVSKTSEDGDLFRFDQSTGHLYDHLLLRLGNFNPFGAQRPGFVALAPKVSVQTKQ